MQTWRERARPIIASIIAEIGTGDMKRLRKELRDAYPFGLRQYHPYKIWCDEIHQQLNPKTESPIEPKRVEPLPNQMSLFESPHLGNCREPSDHDGYETRDADEPRPDVRFSSGGTGQCEC
jgi:hypothetical protein